MVTLTSTELNFMVFRYLTESGFTHTAFAFGNESDVTNSPIDGDSVPPGALIKLVQKGLEYKEMEVNLINPDNDTEQDFSFLQPLDLITKDVHELQRMAKENEKKKQEARGKEVEEVKGGASSQVKHKEKPRRILKIPLKRGSASDVKEKTHKRVKFQEIRDTRGDVKDRIQKIQEKRDSRSDVKDRFQKIQEKRDSRSDVKDRIQKDKKRPWGKK